LDRVGADVEVVVDPEEPRQPASQVPETPQDPHDMVHTAPVYVPVAVEGDVNWPSQVRLLRKSNVPLNLKLLSSSIGMLELIFHITVP